MARLRHPLTHIVTRKLVASRLLGMRKRSLRKTELPTVQSCVFPNEIKFFVRVRMLCDSKHNYAGVGATRRRRASVQGNNASMRDGGREEKEGS